MYFSYLHIEFSQYYINIIKDSFCFCPETKDTTIMKKNLPSICPCCGGLMKAKRLECPSCSTSVEGSFELPLLARLDQEDQGFILNLLKAGGSLKELSAIYGISYPTIRNRLDNLILKVDRLTGESASNPESSDE